MLTLNILSPKGRYPIVECDSVHLTLNDDSSGKGGGSCGIRRGHAKAMLSLKEGNIIAYSDNKKIFEASVGGGFATVENDIVTAVVESFSVIEND